MGKKPCKTVHQYNKQPVSGQDMEKLLEIAADYRTIKNYVFQRYGGIRSLDKMYPGYTIQKELADCPLRRQLELPSVYFNVAILDAIKNIKNQWARTRKKVLKQINTHPEFSEEEKHYLRFLLKVSNAFEMVLNGKEICLEPALQEKQRILAGGTGYKEAAQLLEKTGAEKACNSNCKNCGWIFTYGKSIPV